MLPFINAKTINVKRLWTFQSWLEDFIYNQTISNVFLLLVFYNMRTLIAAYQVAPRPVSSFDYEAKGETIHSLRRTMCDASVTQTILVDETLQISE